MRVPTSVPADGPTRHRPCQILTARCTSMDGDRRRPKPSNRARTLKTRPNVVHQPPRNQVPILSHIRRSIGLTQAAAVLLATVLIGFLFSALQLSFSLVAERDDAIALTRDILDLTEAAATRAAWTLDPNLATDVVASAMTISGVQRAAIADEQGNTLAAADVPTNHPGTVATWLIGTYFREVLGGERQLFATERGTRRLVGVVSVVLTPTHILNNLFQLATGIVITTLVEAFLIGLILLWISSRIVTSPLRSIARTISEIDPQRPEDMSIAVPQQHQRNELGHLLEHTNGMLERLAASQYQLRHLATRDPLTNLPNRALIRDRLASALARAERNDNLVAVLFLDLDRFKNINDTLGHDAGDKLLVAVADRLRDTIRANDSAGRLGGDEFLVVLEDIHELDDVAHTVSRIDDSLSTTITIDSQSVRTTASIGIAVYPDDGRDPGTLMSHADLAMYKAKGGGTRWHFFTRELSTRVEERLRLETGLDGALDRGEFVLHYQPQCDARTGAVAGCEVLVRWRHRGSLREAGEFIWIAEETGFIIDIGNWVLDEVCRQIEDWQTRYEPVPISINVSAGQLHEIAFVSRVLDTAKEHGTDPALIKFEITETVLIEDFDRSITLLARLRETGVGISMDDFGTGYSSLSYLTRLPVNSLKIDRSFISGRRRSTVVLNTILAMAKALQIQTVAEGVETEEQRHHLVSEGCDLLQGYLFSDPVPANEFERRFLKASATSRNATAVDPRGA